MRLRPPSFKYELGGVWGVYVSNMGVQVNTFQRQKHAVLVTARSDGIGDEEVVPGPPYLIHILPRPP